MIIKRIKKIIITDDTTDAELEYIHTKAMREYIKTGKSSYLIVDEDEQQILYTFYRRVLSRF